MDKKYRALVLKMPNNSDKAERRYVIKDMESGEIVDDAQGYVYKSAQKAYAGRVPWEGLQSYRNRIMTLSWNM